MLMDVVVIMFMLIFVFIVITRVAELCILVMLSMCI